MRIGFLSHLDLNLYLFRLPVMKRLVERGDQVFAIVPRGEYFDRFERHGVIPVSYDIDRRSVNPLRELRTVDKIYEALAPLDLDILHTFTAKPNIYGTFAGRRAGIPRIYNLVEGLGSFYVEESFRARAMRMLIERLYKKIFAKSDGCVFVNQDDPRYMVERGLIEPEKVKVIRSVGVDTKLFSPEAVDKDRVLQLKRELSPDGLPIVMMVARAIWHKGIAELYEAAERLDGQASFVLVGGTDPGNPSCADEAFLGKGKVKWLGERDDIVELTASADIYVLPSYREGVPRTLLEAASMGKALVATDVVGCREVVENEYNGLLVEPRNAKALAEAIERLLKEKSLRRKMEVASRNKAVSEFDIEKVVDQYMPLYESSHVS